MMEQWVMGIFVGMMMSNAGAMSNTDEFVLKIGRFEKSYPIKEAQSGSGIKIAYVNDFVDNMALIRAAADAIVAKINQAKAPVDVIVIPGDKANALGAIVVDRLTKTRPNVKLVVFRGSNKGGNVESISYQSISSDKPKKLYSRLDHADLLRGKNAIVLDDVISTGATAKASADLVRKLGGNVIGYACAATEGENDPADGGVTPQFASMPLYKIVHFPVVRG
jgi:adenine phosphoribosyltransferase